MSSLKTFSFTNLANYTLSNAALLEVTGGVGRLKDQRTAFGDGNGITASTFATNGNLNWGDAADKTITLVNGAAVSGGLLDLSINTAGPSSASYSGTDLTDDMIQTGTVRILVQPQYSGTPGIEQVFIKVRNTGNQNAVIISHRTSGQLRVQITDSSGSNIHNANFGVFSPTSGTNYELEADFDVTAGVIRLFVDGVQLGSTATSTGTRSSTQNQILFGDAVGNQDHKTLEWACWSTVIHTANYTIGEVIPESVYSTLNPNILTNDVSITSSITAFLETVVEPGSDAIQYTLVNDGQDRYWSGAAWVNSNGTYGQSNSGADIIANIATALTTRQSVRLRIFFHSDDGSTRPHVDSIQITYNADLPAPTLPSVIELEGFLCGPTTFVSGVAIQVRPYQAWFSTGGVHIQYKFITVDTTDDNGHWQANVLLQPAGKFWEFKIGTKRYKVALPDVAGIVDFSTQAVTALE